MSTSLNVFTKLCTLPSKYLSKALNMRTKFAFCV